MDVMKIEEIVGDVILVILDNYEPLKKIGIENDKFFVRVKGYDEYASVENFPFEVPQQALWINVPEKGILWQTPILVEDRKAEGW